MNLERQIAGRLEQVLGQIEGAARRAGRDPDAVKLVVVTKAHPVERLQAAVAAGVVAIGENYAEEGRRKKLAIDPQGNLEWHMIGNVQSRKAAAVAEIFDVVQSLDRVKLARRMQSYLLQENIMRSVLLQVNVSGEANKFGFPAWEPGHYGPLADFVRGLQAFDRLKIRGLMSIPPFFTDPEGARPYFKKTRLLRDRLQKTFPDMEFSTLSMGMSGDYEVAIEEGASIVRVGTAIMGKRMPK